MSSLFLDTLGENYTHNLEHVKDEQEGDGFEDYQIPLTESDLTSQTVGDMTMTIKDHKGDSDYSISDTSSRTYPKRKKRKAQKRQTKTCRICFKRCWSNTGFQRHMEVHMKEKLFKCTDCDKVFEDKQELVLHAVVHKGEKWFGCDVCGQKFSKNYLRTKHMKEHKRQKTEFCKNSITSHHLRSCKGKKEEEVKQKSFCCMTCGRKFYTASDLKLHMEIHKSWKRHVSEKQENQAQSL